MGFSFAKLIQQGRGTHELRLFPFAKSPVKDHQAQACWLAREEGLLMEDSEAILRGGGPVLGKTLLLKLYKQQFDPVIVEQ